MTIDGKVCFVCHNNASALIEIPSAYLRLIERRLSDTKLETLPIDTVEVTVLDTVTWASNNIKLILSISSLR